MKNKVKQLLLGSFDSRSKAATSEFSRVKESLIEINEEATERILEIDSKINSLVSEKSDVFMTVQENNKVIANINKLLS